MRAFSGADHLSEMNELRTEVRGVSRRFEQVLARRLCDSSAARFRGALTGMTASLQTLPDHASEAMSDALERQSRHIVAEFEAILKETMAGSRTPSAIARRSADDSADQSEVFEFAIRSREPVAGVEDITRRLGDQLSIE